MMHRSITRNPNAIDSGDVPPIRTSRNVMITHNTNMKDYVNHHETQKVFQTSSSKSFCDEHSNDHGSDFESILIHQVQQYPDNFHNEEEESASIIDSSRPTAEHARLFAGLVLSAKSARDLSPEALERYSGKKASLITSSQIYEKERQCGMRTALALILAIIVITIIIAVSTTRLSPRASIKYGLNSDNSSILDSGTYPTPVTVDSPKTGLSPRLTKTTQVLSTFRISTKSNLEDITTPQFQAALWISDLDESAFIIPDSRLHPVYLTFVQRYVLALLYFSTGGHNWNEKSSFLGKKDVCQWFTDLILNDDEKLALGVICNNAGRVNQLLIPRNNLNGKLPSELAHLEALEFIDFNRNNIEGTIPKEYSSLRLMKFFDIRNNRLQGSFPEWIGAEWVELKELAFADNQMYGTLPGNLENLSNLKTLCLARNAFESSIHPINSLRNLEYLYLQENEFTGTVDDTFLHELRKLIQVDISSNKLTSSDIPPHLFEFPFLRVLHLGSNKLMGSLPDFMKENPRLEYLSLFNNILNGTLPETISQLRGLKHLDITANYFSGDIPVSLSTLKKLEFLFLSENDFIPGPVPDFLSSMFHLRELSLSLTHRTGTLPDLWLESLPNLVLLDFSYNDMEGTLPSTLWEHPQLKFLLLNRNRFDGTLPSGIRDTMLQLLGLDKNNVTGDFSEVCEKKVPYAFTDCGEIICDCCTCCEDENPKCNDDLLYSNQDFSWEDGYERNFYAFSPLVLINTSVDP